MNFKQIILDEFNDIINKVIFYKGKIRGVEGVAYIMMQKTASI